MKLKKGVFAPPELKALPSRAEEALSVEASSMTTAAATSMFGVKKKPVVVAAASKETKASLKEANASIALNTPDPLPIKPILPKKKVIKPVILPPTEEIGADTDLLDRMAAEDQLLDSLAEQEAPPAAAAPGLLESLEEEEEVQGPVLKEEEEVQPETKPDTSSLETLLIEEQGKDPYAEPAPASYVPQTRRGFSEFIKTTYKSFALPAGSVTLSKDNKYYPYQVFVREYMRNESPYRGVLVYHGLGSGKTCTSIAAAEALYLSAHKKIIVMTPFSLRKNFLGEISFCGFRQYQLRNFWIPLEKTEETILFATQILGLSTKVLRTSGHIWIPDLTKDQSQSNFVTLTDTEKAEVRSQIRSVVEWDPVKNPTGRFRFINYNGISAAKLQEMACTIGPGGERFFDNAVIVVDEIHNVIRNIHGGKISSYLTKSEGMKVFKRQIPFEEVTVDRWNPTLCTKHGAAGATSVDLLMKQDDTKKGPEKKDLYTRGYLFYRLLMDAKNSKLIGLSGTPMINYPEELGILSNLLHGYIPLVEGVVKQTGEGVLKMVEDLGASHPYIDFVKATTNQTIGGTQVLVSLLPYRVRKLQGGDGGVVRVPEEEDMPEIPEILESIQEHFKKAGLPFQGSLQARAVPLLPVDGESFRSTFVQDHPPGLLEKHKPILLKRLTGLVSYYKGSNLELMPRIKSDEVVYVPFSLYAQKKYSEVRKAEIDLEKKKKKGGPAKEGGSDPLGDLSKEPAGSYKMGSRQACNFVFPSEVARPVPASRKEVQMEAKEGAREEAETLAEEVEPLQGDDGLLTLEEEGVVDKNEIQVDAEKEEADFMDAEDAEDAAAEEAFWREKAEAVVEQSAVAEIGPKPKTIKEMKEKQLADCKGGRKPGEEYMAACIRAKKCLGTIVKDRMMLGKENGLDRHSSKYAAMLERIGAAAGSSLVYSQFLTMEGVGIFRVAMDVNGYAPIEIIQAPEGGAIFSKATIASLEKGPFEAGTGKGQPRYITFSGEEDQSVRSLALNVFNGNFDALPDSMRSVLESAGFRTTGNKKGELCRVFCITSAGAEGLSLKNVRAVHIMEPYWNDVRLRQVKGRAIRIGSHMDLSPEERDVSIFTYISRFSEEAQVAQGGDLRLDETIRTKDSILRKNALELGFPIPASATTYILTSDEVLYGISLKKKVVLEALETVLKAAAVDCELNEKQNKDGTFQCLPLKGKIGEFLYHPVLRDDILENEGKYILAASSQQKKKPVATGMPSVEVISPRGKLTTQIYKGVTYKMREVLGADTTTVTGFEMYDVKDVEMKELLGTAGVNPVGKPGPPVKLFPIK